MKPALKIARVLFGLGLLAALVWFTDVDKVLATLRAAQPAWIGGALTLLVCTTLIGSISMHMLISTEGEISYAQFLPVYWTSWAVGLVFPGQVGDMASMAALLRRHRLAMSTTVGRSMADKLVSLALMILFAAWAVRHSGAFPALLGGAAALAVGALALLRYRSRLPFMGRLAENRVARFIGAALAETAALVRRRPGLIALNVLFTMVKICLTGLAYWCMFRALGFEQARAWDVIPLVAISSLVAYIPVSFNGIGTAEATGIYLFSSVGVTPTGVLATYLLLRMLVLALAWIPAAAWLLLARPGPQAAQ